MRLLATRVGRYRVERGARSGGGGRRHGVENAGVRLFLERGFVQEFQGIGIVRESALALGTVTRFVLVLGRFHPANLARRRRNSGLCRGILRRQEKHERARLEFTFPLRRDDVAGVHKLLFLIEIIQFGGGDINWILGIAAR